MDRLTKLQKENEYLGSLVSSLSEQLLANKEQLLTNKEQIKAKDSKIAELLKLNDWYIEQLALRKKEKYGTSSEKLAGDQLSFFGLFDEAEAISLPISVEPKAEDVFVAAHTKKRAKRGEFTEDLPLEVIEYKLEGEDLVCEQCAHELSTMKKETRIEIQIIPAQVKRVEHVSYFYSCTFCDKEGESGLIKKAPSPGALIPRSLVSPSFLSYILNQKYTLALPLNRQEQEFKRLGINLSRQNLSNWTLKGAGLLAELYEGLKSELLAQEYLHGDETTLEVLDEPGRKASQKSYMWLYRTSSYSKRPVILFDYQRTRAGENARVFLRNWQGKYLHCDGYAGYKKLEGKSLCGCWVHAKRKFHEAWKANQKNEEAKRCEGYISKLFTLENQAEKSGFTQEERLEMRRTSSARLVKSFYDYIEELSIRILPKSLLGQAITYAINQREPLSTFLEDPKIQLSNNLAEQAIRHFVIGRNNWLFSASPRGATSSAIIYSVIQTAMASGLKPYHYLNYVFEQIQLEKDLQIEDLLPWSERIPEECKK